MNFKYRARVGSPLALSALALSLNSALPAWAHEKLFELESTPRAAAVDKHAKKAQGLTLNPNSLNEATLSLDLFGEQVTALRTRIERHKAGQVVWVGHIEGNPLDTVVVTLRGKAASAIIRNGADSYTLGQDAQGRNQLVQLDLAALPPEHPPFPMSTSPARVSDAFAASAGNAVAAAAAAGVTVEQTLLVAYTNDACSLVGSCAQLEAHVVTAVTELNAIYAKSGVGITMKLVGMVKTTYASNTAGRNYYSEALRALKNGSDGQLDEILPLRNALGADLVTLLVTSNGACGVANLGPSPEAAYNVVNTSCLIGNLTLAHELGHNQGLNHDRATAGGGVVGAYNYGYRRCNDGSVDDLGAPYFRDLMSYKCADSTKVGYFSNPNINYLGVPMGIDPVLNPARGADGARRLNETATIVAANRAPPTVLPPTAPSNLTGAASGYNAIKLFWNDNASTEASYVVQRSTDNAVWTTVAMLAANTAAYTDSGLLSGKTYYYRVAAENLGGRSGYSTATLSTATRPTNVINNATGEIAGRGSVTGTFLRTRVNDRRSQVITEVTGTGSGKTATKTYTHTWLFNVVPGASAVVAANSWVSNAKEGANFYYSTDAGTTWKLMFSNNSTAENTTQTFTLPVGTSGAVRIQARDAARTPGESAEKLSVDYLVITTSY